MDIINTRTDWAIEKLGKFAIHEKGKKPKNQKDIQDDVYKFAYINIEAFEKGIFKSFTDGEKCNFCSDGDFLMVWDGSRSGLVGKGISGALGSTLVRINFPGIDNDFAYFFLKSKYQQINTRAKGTGTPHVDPGLLWNYDYPIAPLPEQRAIVAKIEELFSSLDSGIADLKKAQEQLKIYRQAVLKKAFEGGFLNVEDSFSKLSIVKLGSLIEKPKYGTSKKCILKAIGIPVLRIPNIRDGKVDKSELKYAEFDQNEISNLALNEGDILTIRSNGSVDLVGKCALISKFDTEFLYAGYLIRLRPNSLLIDSTYLLHCLSSYELRVQIESKAKSTSGVNNINSGELQDLDIPIFNLINQKKIVQEIESRLSVCDKVEESIVESLEKSKALRQSILKKAFEGKLLNEAEIAACKAAPDYEPASVLLERIKKAAVKKKK